MVRPHQLLWPAPNPEDAPGGLLGFSATALVVGALTGLVTGSFRLALDAVSAGRTWLVGWARGTGARALLLVVLLCAAATAAAASLVHRIEPHAEGSGIPRVEGVVEGRVPPGRPLILPVKYVGGLLAIGAGLALGHEGPSVQMGGNIGIIASRIGRRNRHDLRILVAAGAAAGLATAFNAPIAGGVFVLEELIKRFDPRATLATLLASGSGFASARLLIGPGDVFATAPARGVRAGHAGRHPRAQRAHLRGAHHPRRARRPPERRRGARRPPRGGAAGFAGAPRLTVCQT